MAAAKCGDAMGPIALFDKSFLQSISLDEAVWFDRFFLPVVCPVFYVETLADLAKEPSKRGPPEVIVRDIASKFPEMGGSPCVFHGELCIADLLGHHTPMDGRVPRPGGRPVKSGTVFEPSAEETAFERWHQGRFFDVERIAAAFWRKQLSELNLEAVAKEFRALGIDGKSYKSLEQARDVAQAIVKVREKAHTQLALATVFLSIPQEYHRAIFEAWQAAGRRSLAEYAPYAAYVLSVEIFFQIALAARLIDSGRASNRTDIAYLFYLPFSMIFVSSDKLHRRTAPLFMTEDQEFVWGIDLKAGLSATNAHFLNMPEEIKEKGIMSFADVPPDGNIVSDLWDRRMRKGVREEPSVKLSPEDEAKLLQRLKEFEKQPTLDADAARETDDDMISIKRSIRRKRGSWWQVPKDLPDEKEED